ncbi:DEAD/DEAH box helicase [Photobacterium damselae]|uniref:DEAD/DEAH box helicase n=1 Tax=Photobacterium damselae TaxID=38293 RepID=UPI00406894B8
MKRIRLENSGDGRLNIKYPFSEWKNNKLRPLKLHFVNTANPYWETSISRTMEVIDHIKAVGGNMSVSTELQREFGVNKYGYTPAEQQSEDDYYQNHPSFADQPSEEFREMAKELFAHGVTPYDYQLAGIERIIEMNGRGLIADDMGLGKTMQAIGIASYYRDKAPILIASPLSLLYNWEAEFMKFTDWADVDDIVILDNGKKSAKETISICTYKYISTHLEELKDYLGVNGILIVDEAHAIKELDTQIGQTIVELMQFVDCAVTLTGTPILNRVRELYPILYGLDPVVFQDKYSFFNTYCEGARQQIGNKTIYTADGSSNTRELMKLLRDNYMVRRLKSDVLPQLPAKRRTTVTLNVTKADLDINQFIEKLRRIAKPLLKAHDMIPEAALSDIRLALNEGESDGKKGDPIFKLFIDAGLAKIEPAVDWLTDRIAANEDLKFIMFSFHKDVQNALIEAIMKRFPKYSHIKIDGEVSPKNRQLAKDKFQEDPNCHFAFLTYGAGYAGITLTAAHYVVPVQMPWSPEIAIQAEDRPHRIGLEHEIEIPYLLGNNEFDAYMYKMLESKSDVSTSTLDGDKRGTKFSSNTNDVNDDEENFTFNSDDTLLTLLHMIRNEMITLGE